MTGPYGITQVDIPGALNVLEQARSNRIRQMMLQRQLDQDERTQERETGVRTALARFTGTAQPGKAGEPTAPTGMAAAYSGNAPYFVSPDTPHQAAPASVPASVPAVAPLAAGTGDRQALLNELLVIDPQQAVQIQTALSNMDEARVEQTGRVTAAMARAGQYLLGIPEAERAAELQRITPELIAQGVPADRIAGFQPTTRNIQFAVAQARDIERIIESAAPHPMVEPQGGRIIDTNSIDPTTGRPRVISESPTIEVGGLPYARPPSMTSPPQVGEIRNGRPYLGGDPASPQSWGPRQGGAGQPEASRPFP